MSTSNTAASRPGRRRPAKASRALWGTASLALATTGLTVAAAGPAQSAPSPCPAAYPVADLTTSQPVEGLTVSSGTTPDPFTGSVVGVLADGIAPGLDMILVELTSTEIDRVGIWAGMSGSPVYAADGRLIGAVSYVLSWGPTPVAGVTPAADLRDLGPGNPRRGAGTDTVALPKATARRLVRSGVVTRAEADAGMRRLPTPMAISGIAGSKRFAQAEERLGRPDLRLFRAGSAAAPGPAADPGPALAEGSNLGAAVSYGDLSFVGLGTVTMVCGGEVIGFGHPMLFEGATTLSMHNADAVHVQADPVFGGFKVGNPYGAAGTIDQDRLAGIKGTLGAAPEAALVTSTAKLGAKERTGETWVNLQDWVTDVSLFAALSNQDRVLDRIGKGSAWVSIDVEGTTKAGKPFSLSRADRVTSSWDLSWEAAWPVLEALWTLQDNPFTAVDIDSVAVRTLMREDHRRFTLAKVQRWKNGAWRQLRPGATTKARAGQNLRLRLTLKSARDEFAPKVVRLKVRVPDAAGEVLPLQVGSPRRQGWGGAGSLAELIDQIESAPRADQMAASLAWESAVKQVGDVVSGKRRFKVRVVG